MEKWDCWDVDCNYVGTVEANSELGAREKAESQTGIWCLWADKNTGEVKKGSYFGNYLKEGARNPLSDYERATVGTLSPATVLELDNSLRSALEELKALKYQREAWSANTEALLKDRLEARAEAAGLRDVLERIKEDQCKWDNQAKAVCSTLIGVLATNALSKPAPTWLKEMQELKHQKECAYQELDIIFKAVCPQWEDATCSDVKAAFECLKEREKIAIKALEIYADRKAWREEVIDKYSGACSFFDWNGDLQDEPYEIAENALKIFKKEK